MRGYDRRAAEAGEYLFEHLRCAVDWVGNADINSRVKDRYHAERAYLLIYRKHPLVVREEALIVGVQLYSLYARVVQPVKLAYCIRALEMHAAERDENAVAEQGDCKVVDLFLLMGIGGYVEHRRPVRAAREHARFQPRSRAVEGGAGVARTQGKHGHGFFGERVGKAVSVHIYNHKTESPFDPYIIL